MGPNLAFYKDDKKIKRSLEDSINLKDIAWKVKNEFHIKIKKENDEDWNELIEQCAIDMGFTYENDRIQLAKLQAFTINVTTIKPQISPLFSGTREFKCEQQLDGLFKENLIFNCQMDSPYLSYLSLLAGLTLERTNELKKSRVESTTYSYECIEKAKLNIDKTNVILENDFIEDVNSALDAKYSRKEKINKLIEISKKYGHFYANEVVFGGAIIKNIKNINEQKHGRNSNISFGIKNNQTHFGLGYNSENTVSKLLNISQKTLTIIGGNVAFYVQDDQEAIKLWRNSVNDPKQWRIISYNIRPIFDLLDDERKNKVLEAFGKQILKARITTRNIELQQLSTCPIVLEGLDKEIKDVTSNPLQCQIFASIINQDNRVYSLRVEYLDKNTPAFVIHYIGGRKNSKKKQQCEIQVGWIIIGYPEKFIFEQRNNEMEVIINEKKCDDEEMEKMEIENNHSYRCTINPSSNSCCKLGISVIESPEVSTNYSVYNSKIVTGAHFSPENMACLFIQNLDKNHNIGDNIDENLRLKMVYGIIDAESLLLKVRLKNCKKYGIISNSIDDYKKLSALDKEDKKILSSILEGCGKIENGYNVGNLVFMNVVNKCDHHGFVNITPQYLLYDSLNNTSNEFEGHISCLPLRFYI
ncbi:665_t:CDS:2 [Cetraspora pellucida]|uniref:665_t:CDS:1 n=1 Tax=Cetraspora pellucida TaxID=1433469 RepID=A0ACA9KRU5_9GLOM|nr:665_t:CDS:2 [Cetraspora pellucida]